MPKRCANTPIELRSSPLERSLTARLGQPVTATIRDWLREGLTVPECLDRLEATTGVKLARSTIYKWLRRDTPPMDEV